MLVRKTMNIVELLENSAQTISLLPELSSYVGDDVTDLIAFVH